MSKKQEPLSDSLMDPAARVKVLSKIGQDGAKMDKSTPIKHYCRCASQMRKQSQIYYKEGNLENAFILDHRFLTLFVEKLNKHPGYAKVSSEDKRSIKSQVNESLEQATQLKAKLLEKYEKEKQEHVKALQEEANKRIEDEERRRTAEEAMRRVEEESLRAARDEAARKVEVEAKEKEVEGTMRWERDSLATGGGLLDANAPVISVAKGIEKTTLHDTITTEPPIPPFVPAADHVLDDKTGITSGDAGTQPVVTNQMQWGLKEGQDDVVIGPTPMSYVLPATASQGPQPSAPPPPSYQSSMWQPSKEVGVAPADPWSSSFATSNSMVSGPLPTSTTSYTSPRPQATAPPYEPPSQQQQNTMLYQFPPSIVPPSYTPSPVGNMWGPLPLPTGAYNPDVSARPTSAPIPTSPRRPQAEESQVRPSTAVPTFDRSLKPVALTTSLGGYGGYRPVYVPADIARRFEQAAAHNTQMDAETCGILAGKLSNNELRITHLIIPKQTGTANSCEMMNEEEMFDVQDKYDVITLGWIHTHPTQTAFLSSVDLHTQYSYQVMMDEAVAIVCAPQKGTVGMFTLTNPHGLDVISRCEQGGFHKHPSDPPLFEECSHVRVDDAATIEIVDLRH